jgi:phasin family protein
MTDQASYYIDMLRKFGNDLRLPKVDVDRLLESHKKNIDALSQSATVAAQGAKSVAEKQHEVFEAGLQEATKLARGLQPLGKVQENLALQTEFAKKVFEIALKGAQDGAAAARQSSGEAAKIIQDRLKESFSELQSSFNRDKST